MSSNSGSACAVPLQYESIRNLTSPEEKSNQVQTYFANVPAREILKLDTNRNLRNYIPNYSGKSRNTVHKEIADTICNAPDKFINRNGGFTVTASDIYINNDKKEALVTNPSIINGAQSKGEIQRYLEKMDSEAHSFHVRVEFIVNPNSEHSNEVAIARNTSTNVQRISIAGSKGCFEELEASFQQGYPQQKLRKSETELDDSVINTRKLIQVISALMPQELIEKKSTHPARKSFVNIAQCLLNFEKIYEEKKKGDLNAIKRYQFFIDMAATAWAEYLYWQEHKDWIGHRLMSQKVIERDGKKHKVSDGVVFPILGAISSFVEKNPKTKKWEIYKPNILDDTLVINIAVGQIRNLNNDPILMGRTPAAYEALMIVPQTYQSMMANMKAA